MTRITKSLKIDSDIWKKIKKHCVNKDIYISDYIEKLVEEDLNVNKVSA